MIQTRSWARRRRLPARIAGYRRAQRERDKALCKLKVQQRSQGISLKPKTERRC